MTLRLRLTLALLALTTIGLGVFGVVTYQLYARSQYNQLDSRLRQSAQREAFFLADDLYGSTGNGNGGKQPPQGFPTGGFEGDEGGGPRPATWSQLRSNTTREIVNTREYNAAPTIPDDLAAPTTGAYFTTLSGSDGQTWRVYVAPATASEFVIVADPTSDVTATLNRLILIEGTAAACLLIMLGVGSWYILRHGLRPLENMAGSAREITGGDLSHRVSPAEPKTEVGQLGLALNTMLDEIEEAFDERDRTEQRLRQFLADASHELRTPLTSIQGFAELFRVGASGSRPASPSGSGHVDQAVIMRRIEEESVRMKDLVEDLLLLARLDQTRPANREPVDLTVLAADACSDAVALDQTRPITLDAPEPVVVLGDRDHLRQAIANLVANAVRHTPEGSPIEVSSLLDGGVASVSVRDHGPGLDPDALAHAFDRFWQADSARVGHGAGLGLAIVAGIAGEHGGEITAANAPDGGAVFTLRFPLNAPTTPPVDAPVPVA